MWMSATSAVPAEKLRRQPSALSATLLMPSAEHWMPSSPIRTSLSVQSHERYFLLFARKMSPKRNSLQLLKVFDGISRIRPPSRSACVSPKSAAHSALPHYLQYRKNVDAQITVQAKDGSELLNSSPREEPQQLVAFQGSGINSADILKTLFDDLPQQELVSAHEQKTSCERIRLGRPTIHEIKKQSSYNQRQPI